ncbi:MAG: high-potential iron-sulfur protein [Bradymonadaceae bacterium]
MNERTYLSRRQFLERAALLGAVSVGGAAFLAACESQPAQPAAAPEAAAADFSCTDVSGLNAAQIATRTTNEYVDQTPNPEQRCDNCALWVDPAAGENCGGCSVVAGPIHPAGWCKIWVPAS